MANKPSYDELIERMKKAAVRSMTAEERFRQKVSFVKGTIGEGNTLTDHQIEELVRKSA